MSHPQQHLRSQNKHATHNYEPVSDETAYKGFDQDVPQTAYRSISHRRRMTRGWTPISLSVGALIGFSVWFVCCLVALILLRIFAGRTDGFTLLTNNHYTWTYGPTAVLIIVISCWRQVEYHSKALLAWSELSRGPASADRTILLDHISPFQLVTLFHAGIRLHFSVVAAITGFLVLKIVTIASTGLLFPATVAISTQQADLQFTSRIENGTALTREQANTYGDPTPGYTAWAILERGYPYPPGMTDTIVYETFELANTTSLANVTFSAEVNAFVPRVECTAVRAEVMLSGDPFSPTAVIKDWDIKVLNDSTWTCPNNTRVTYYEAQVTGCDLSSRYCPPRSIWPTFGRVPCNRTTGHNPEDADPILLALSDLRYNQTWNHTLSNYSIGDMITPSSWQFSIPTMKTLLCQPSYSIQRARVDYNMSGSVVKITALQSPSLTNSTLESFATQNLTNEIYLAMSTGEAAEMFGSIANDFNLYAEQPPNTIMRMVASRVGGDYQTLLDDDSAMHDAAEAILTALAIQIGRKDVLRPVTKPTSQLNGQQSYTVEHLRLQPASVYIMEVGFATMILIAIIMIVVRPNGTGSYNPETTKAKSTTLIYSTDLHSNLLQLNSHEEAEAKRYMKQDRYYSLSAPGTEHQMICSEQSIIGADNSRTSRQTWWSPITLSIPFLGITLCSALVLIGVLEGLQHISNSSQGLGSVAGMTPFLISFYTRFLPAFITLLVATMFNSLDFNTAMLAPFSSLRARAGSRRHLGSSLLAYLPPVALYRAFKQRYWMACITLIAAIIGSGLTLVVSGLYTVQDFQYSTQVAMTPIDNWNLSIAGNSLSNSATAAVSSLVESANLSYPAFTYGDLVFPALVMENDSDSLISSNNSGFINVKIPALRAELSCTDFTNFNFTPTYNSHYNYSSIEETIHLPLPITCQRGGSNGNLSYISTSVSVTPSSTTNTTYFGSFLDLHVGPFNWLYGLEDHEYDLSQPDNPPECPTVYLVYGYADIGPKNVSAVTMKYCYQHVKTIQTNVTFDMPSLTISSEYPPIPDESTAQLVGIGMDNQTGFPWRIQADIDNSFALLNLTGGTSKSVNRSAYGFPSSDSVYYSDESMSNFYLGALFGMDPLDIHALADKTQHPQVFDHLQSFYGRYMAQSLSANMRVSANSTSQPNKRASDIVSNPSTLQGTFTPTIGTPRLIQNRTPKLVLQIMLGIMFVCGAIAWIFGDLHQIVPWNPCTIAGTMILFAGSKMCYPPQVNLDTDNDKNTTTTNLVNPDTSGKRMTRFRSLRTYSERDEYIDRNEYELNTLSPDDITTQKPKRNRGKSPAGESQKSLLRDAAAPSGTSLDRGRGLDTSEDTKVILIADQSLWDHPRARFRLGWWRDGVFMGTKPPEFINGNGDTRRGRGGDVKTSGVDSGGYVNVNGHDHEDTERKDEVKRWRYGIDVL